MDSLLVVGDIGYRGRVANFVSSGKGILLFNEFIPYIKSSTWSMLNLESPVGDSSLYIKKCGPCISCTNAFVRAIKDAGFTGVTLANNHFYDCGQKGVENTIRECQVNGLKTVGGGVDLIQASKNLILETDNLRITIINVCEQEFSLVSDFHGGSKHLEPIKQYYEILKARAEVHYIIIIIHGGHEYYQLPSPRMQEVYRFFIDIGADAVINHHQHCYSGYEIYKGKPIFYGLGNFCFDSAKNLRNHIWNSGYAVKLYFDNEKLTFDIIPYIQCNEEVGVRCMSESEKLAFDLKIVNLNEIIANPSKLGEAFEQYAVSLGDADFMKPLYNGLTARYYKKKWFPSFLTKKQRYYQLHFIQNEAHRDTLLIRLKNKLNLR